MDELKRVAESNKRTRDSIEELETFQQGVPVVLVKEVAAGEVAAGEVATGEVATS